MYSDVSKREGPRTLSKNRVERRSVLAEFWRRPTTNELDVVDKGDSLMVQSCSPEVAAWWMGTLRAMYPQDVISGGEGDNFKMHPAMGVTLKLNRQDGTLTIKGKKHLQWFKDNFSQVLENSGSGLNAVSEMSKFIDSYLRINDDYSVAELLEHLPPSGAVKHGPTYVYRLWKGLLDQWIAGEGKIYVISPLLDSKRLADIILMLAKNKLSTARVTMYTTMRCDGEFKYPKVFKGARDMVKELKTSTKKRLIVDERMSMALDRLDSKFGSFHVKLIASCTPQYTEVLVTSASFHSMHFHYDHTDMVLFMRIHTEDFTRDYLEPLGLAPRLTSGSAPLLSRNSSDNSTL